MRGIQATSRRGRFHNTRYLLLAEELGLAVAKRGSDGWTDTAVPDAAVAAYRAELRCLDEALIAYRRARYVRLARFSFLILIGRFVILEP